MTTETASTSTDTPVLLESDGNVAHIILNRPQSLNALNVSLLDGLLDALATSQSASALVIYGAGRALCAGEDLRETLAPTTGDLEELRVSFEKLQQLTRLMINHSAPIVVAAHGYAVGGGAELALSGDFVVASPDVRFKFPEVVIGHAVTGGISARLAATVGLIRAKQLLLTGRWIGAEEALSWGMVTEVNEQAIERAQELGRELVDLPRRSMSATKRGVELAVLPHQESVFEMEIGAALHCFSSVAALAAYEPFQRSIAEGDKL